MKFNSEEYFETVKEQLNEIWDLDSLPTQGELLTTLEEAGCVSWELVPIVNFSDKRELVENVYKRLRGLVEDRGADIFSDMYEAVVFNDDHVTKEEREAKKRELNLKKADKNYPETSSIFKERYESYESPEDTEDFEDEDPEYYAYNKYYDYDKTEYRVEGRVSRDHSTPWNDYSMPWDD